MSFAESVTKMMMKYGNVKLVRICSKDTKGKLPTWLTVSLIGHEMDAEDDAKHAVHQTCLMHAD